MKPHKKLTKSNHPIDEFPQEILAGIGEIVARWGYLQFQLGVIVREILNIPKDKGRVLTYGPELGVLCNMIRNLTATNDWINEESIRTDLEKLAEKVRDKSAIRNDYAHGVFGYGEKENEFVRFLMKQPKHKIKPGTEVLSAATLNKHAAEARSLWVEAQDITDRLKATRGKRR